MTTRLFDIIFLLLCISCTMQNKDRFKDFSFNRIADFQLDTCISMSACIVDNKIYIVSGLVNTYYCINIDSQQIVKKEFSVDIEQPNQIIYSDNSIIISDIMNKSLTYLDLDMNFKKRILLNDFPLDIKIHDKNAYYITDYLSSTTYKYIIKQENLQTHKEEVLYHGDTISILQLRQFLDLNKPQTMCFDIYNDDIFVAKQQYDIKEIDRINMNQIPMKTSFLKDSLWEPILYTPIEKNKIFSIIKTMLSSIKYPSEQIYFSHKLAINSITIDNSGNLWVLSPGLENKIKVAIYSIDGEQNKEFILDGYITANLILSDKYFAVYNTDTIQRKMTIYEIQR